MPPGGSLKVNKRLALGAAAIAAAAIAVPASARTNAGGSGSQPCANMTATADGTVTPSTTTLWPPNHKMHTVTISYTAPSDVPGDVSTIKIAGIVDDQANADGSGEVQGSGAPTDVQGL